MMFRMSEQQPHTAFIGEFDELFDPNASTELRQGDVLQLIPRQGSSEFECHFGVIVTANCDLALGKNFGILTYIPIIPVECYIQQFILPRLMELEERGSLQRLRDQVLKKADEILYERVVDMIYSENYKISEICDGLPDYIEIHAEIEGHATILSAVKEVRKSPRPAAAMSNLAILAKVLDEVLKPRKPHLNRFSKDLHSRVVKSPDDCLFLGKISAEHNEGYTAVLRMLRELSDDRVALSPIAEREHPGHFWARRVSRLKTLYIHRLVQQMSRVFTDIGLPVDYEASRETVVAERLHLLLFGPSGTLEG
jgi:hypothetical protein